MRISSKNGIKTLKNKNSDNQSVISSDYIFLKNGNVKRKRSKNSYFETFLEKRRMAAEFAQSKRCYSTISTKIQHVNKNTENRNKPNNKLSYQGLQEIINMNNLKHNLPGKAKPIIDNTDNILKTNYENNNISEEDNNADINSNKLNNYFSQKNISFANKNHNKDDLTQPFFDEIRHLTNKSNANNEMNNNLIPPYELEIDTNEETSKFGNEVKIIDTNKSRKIEMIPEKHFEIINKNKYDKLKNSVNTYIKKRPIRDENNQISTLLQSKNHKYNSNDTNPVNISISFRNDFNKNNNNNNIGNKTKKNNNKNIDENINSNDLNIKYNENKNKDMNRYVETNNNEDNDNNIEFFKSNEKKLNINNDININKNNFNENNNNEEININYNNTNNTQTTQNDVSNDIIEETNIIKVNDEISNEKEKQFKIENININKNSKKIYIRDNNLKPSFQTMEETNKSKKLNKIEEKNIITKTIDVSIGPKENKNQKIYNNNNSKNIINFDKNNNNDNSNPNIYLNNNINNFEKIPLKNMPHKNITKIEKKNNQNIYSLMISNDIEKLKKLKQSSQRNKEPNYFNEINSFIDNIKKRRENLNNNEYINLTNENREKLVELQNQKKDLKLFQNQINSALNYNKISFHSTKNFKNRQNNITYNNFNNNKNRNDFKVKITTRMQGLLNKLEKEKISNNIDKFENSNNSLNIDDNDDNKKNIFTQNVINSINNFIETENNQIISNKQVNHINNINNNNNNNNFILLQNYYNNENNFINNRKNKKSKKNYFNYVSFDEIKKPKDRNIISNRECKNNNNNKNIHMNNNDINVLDEKINKLLRSKNNRASKSRPNQEINLTTGKKMISFLNDDNYNFLNNNSKRYDKSSDFFDLNFNLDKLNEINKNKGFELFKSKSKRSWNPLNLLGINNKVDKIDEIDIKIMPVNNIKSLF